MGVQPNSSQFRMLAGAAIAYGLTTGGPNAPEIGITPLGMRVVRPTAEGDDLRAKREALLKPRVIGEFLRKYADAPIPREDIALNVLQDMSVPKARAKAVFDLIVSGAESGGLTKQIKGKNYISLDTASAAALPSEDVDVDAEADELADDQPFSGVIHAYRDPGFIGRDVVRCSTRSETCLRYTRKEPDLP